jgi:chaperonin GroEL
MMGKDVLHGAEGRARIAKGMNTVAKAVAVTLGGKGRNVVIQTHPDLPPKITKDGVTVANSITCSDMVENIGATMIKEVAQRTVNLSGDGTTTASVLTASLVNSGMEILESDPSVNVVEMKAGMDAACAVVVDYIKSVARPVEDAETLARIATISANNDRETGELIADVMGKVGRDGVVTCEAGTGTTTTVDIVNGMQIHSGYVHTGFINTPQKMQCILEDVLIAVTDRSLSTEEDVKKLLTLYVADQQLTNRSLLLVCGEIESVALNLFLLNLDRGGLPRTVCVVTVPEMGMYKKNVLEDISIVTSSAFISKDRAEKMSDFQQAYFGRADKVVVGARNFTIIGGKGDAVKIEDRAADLRGQYETITGDQYGKDQIKIRLARISGGVAVIRVGGLSEGEIGERRDRMDDAICATRAAQEEGYVAGGGVCLMAVRSGNKFVSGTKSENIGAKLVFDSIAAPYEQMLYNAGISQKRNWFSRPKPINFEAGMGYNAKTGQVENMVLSGIIDPAKVVRVALENAVSVAGTFLTTECVIALQESPFRK